MTSVICPRGRCVNNFILIDHYHLKCTKLYLISTRSFINDCHKANKLWEISCNKPTKILISIGSYSIIESSNLLWAAQLYIIVGIAVIRDQFAFTFHDTVTYNHVYHSQENQFSNQIAYRIARPDIIENSCPIMSNNDANTYSLVCIDVFNITELSLPFIGSTASYYDYHCCNNWSICFYILWQRNLRCRLPVLGNQFSIQIAIKNEQLCIM